MVEVEGGTVVAFEVDAGPLVATAPGPPHARIVEWRLGGSGVDVIEALGDAHSEGQPRDLGARRNGTHHNVVDRVIGVGAGAATAIEVKECHTLGLPLAVVEAQLYLRPARVD